MELPATYGKYELRQLVGRGATGAVYRAIDTFSGEVVAFKLVDKSVLESPDFNEDCRRQFMSEAGLAGQLRHPHIVDIIEAAVTDELAYIVMEYIPGGTLQPYTKPSSLLDFEDALQVLFKCCGALDYALRQGILHRDIKPANIMVPSLHEVKVTDFGASMFCRAQVTQAGSVGTPYYMSPEQIRGEALSPLSDLYALGVVGYELLTGQRPFTGETLPELFASIHGERPRPPSELRRGLPPAVDPVILKMIEKRPEDRFQSWAELALEIGKLVQFSSVRQETSDSEKFRSLCQLRQFADFSDPEIWELVRACAWSKLPPGMTIIREGDLVEAMYVLVRGNAKVTRDNRLLNTLSAGDWFGEMACFQDRKVRRTSVQVVTDALVAEMPICKFAGLSERVELKVCRIMLRMLVDRLTLSDSRIMQAQ